MIATVTLNAALDVTYTVDHLRPYTTHRVRAMTTRAGGKGLNVARVLAALGDATTVTGLAGGTTGEAIRADLRRAGLRSELARVAGESRRTVAVVDGVDATIFNEDGPPVLREEWERFCTFFAELAREADVVVCSGSLPPGVPPAAYAVLVGIARGYGAHTVVDSEGAALRDALAAHPRVVKPNLAELTATTGITDPVLGAHALRAEGAEAVVVTLGADGLVAVTAHGAWRAAPPARVTGNPTGAGDACVAALARGLARDTPWPERLRDAVALSAAAVRAPMAGEFDDETYRRMRPAILVEELECR